MRQAFADRIIESCFAGECRGLLGALHDQEPADLLCPTPFPRAVDVSPHLVTPLHPAGDVGCPSFLPLSFNHDIELPLALRPSVPECIVELERPGHGRMRIEIKGAPAPDLGELSRSFWSMES